jgi:hypothetical protein
MRSGPPPRPTGHKIALVGWEFCNGSGARGCPICPNRGLFRRFRQSSGHQKGMEKAERGDSGGLLEPGWDFCNRSQAFKCPIYANLSPARLLLMTSWTRDPDIAHYHATKNGPGGVVLRVPQGKPRKGATWSWEWSPDEYNEEEVLMRGFRNGVEVFIPW